MKTTGTVVVIHPNGFDIDCEGNALRKISLPAAKQIACTKPTDPLAIPQFNLTLEETLVHGEYAFAVKTIIPGTTPANNLFSVQLFRQDDDYFARDAAVNINGLLVQSGLDIQGVPLK